jgi:uncharacterized protein YjbJ (UPF0337 family)
MENSSFGAIGQQVKGFLKQRFGRMIGDAKLQADGAADLAIGHSKNNQIGQMAGIDTDRLAGIGHELRGSVKTGIAYMTGDADLEAAGNAERAAGKAQNAAGSARDEARDISKTTSLDPTKLDQPHAHE